MNPVVSNHMGPNGESIDRLYGSPASGGTLRLIQKDYTTYKGGISRKALTVKGVDGIAFRSYCYVTDDKRWFNRSGMPIDKPKNLLSEKDA
tara:strand:+ start:3964 stop:4236 length:273 start_codon:yes stop_codon:yes gene_type:complete